MGQRAVLHLHSRVTACAPVALTAARWLAGHGLTWVTPSREDAANTQGLRAIDNGVALPSGPGWRSAETAGGLRLVFVGWMIHEKGIFELLDALAEAAEVRLTAYGPNVRPRDFEAWAQKVADRGLEHRVSYGGALSPEGVTAAMLEADALILPSHS
ncbi:MAG TPA: glycosyltransferase, partial [Myxococcota bacterium]|nr:glycosyltransferase [Myxococcota bacterium]